MRSQNELLSDSKGIEAMVEDLLGKTMSRSNDLVGLTVVTREGLPIASLITAKINVLVVSAMSSAILVPAKRVIDELERGNLNKTIIQGSNGIIVLMEAGPDAVLLGFTDANARMGVVLFDMERAASAIAELISPP
ncbi:MAG: roadblock/LC7 domain-containing protein [Candidatus Hermodarchaeota archaeon]